MLATTLAFVFGGCCTNALSLQQLTSQHKNIGHLITFSQFAFISLYGLITNTTFTPYPRLRKRRIPLYPYLAQVALYSLTSLLNNAAFAYNITIGVHIIFRSGGLVTSMFLGWIVAGKRYSMIQVASVALVTIGVILTTVSASGPPRSVTTTEPKGSYAMGIAILTLALLLSGFLGLVQDWTYSTYGRNPSKDASFAPPHQESMFYLHILSLPLFIPMYRQLISQFNTLTSTPRIPVPFALPGSTLHLLTSPGIAPLLMNMVTQLLCSSGVHRLTMSYSALTVTLVLVIRKAASLILSVLLYGERTTGAMWLGAFLVLTGTAGYAVGSSTRKTKAPKEDKVD